MAQDKEGRTGFFSQSGGTSLSRYTSLDVPPDGPPVRLLHKGKLPIEQRDAIRANIVQARKEVDESIAALSKGVEGMGAETRKLVAAQLGIQEHLVNQDGIDAIRRSLEKVADGLYSSKTEIKVVDRVYSGEVGRNRIKRAPYRETAGRAKSPGVYSDALPDVNLKMSKLHLMDAQAGPKNIMTMFALASAGVNARQADMIASFIGRMSTAIDKDKSLTRVAADIQASRTRASWFDVKPPQYESVVKAPASTEGPLNAASAIHAHINDAAERGEAAAKSSATAAKIAGNEQVSVDEALANLIEKQDSLTAEEVQRITDRLLSLKAKGVQSVDKSEIDAVPNPAEAQATGRESGESHGMVSANAPSGQTEYPKNDLQGVEDQFVGLTNAANKYEAPDREAITKALLEGLNESQHDQVLRGLQSRAKTSIGR